MTLDAFEMKMIGKYVKDLKGLVIELRRWGRPLVAEDMFHDAVVFHWGRLFKFLNFEDITFGPPRGWTRKEGVFDAKFDAAGWITGKSIPIEFEKRSSGFQDHMKKGQVGEGETVLILCWRDDWHDRPIRFDVLALEWFWDEYSQPD
jgi:hypothetical protein